MDLHLNLKSTLATQRQPLLSLKFALDVLDARVRYGGGAEEENRGAKSGSVG